MKVINYKEKSEKQTELISKIKMFWDISKIRSLAKLESEIAQFELGAEKQLGGSEIYYLTRVEVSEMFKISLVTLHNWTKSGILKSYKKGYRILYDASEVAKITFTKYGNPN